MKTISLNDDAQNLWNSHCELSLTHTAEITFRRPRILKRHPQAPVSSVIGLISKPTSRVRIVDRGMEGAEHRIVVASWNLREKDAHWPNPQGDEEVIPHSDVESITFHDTFGNPVLKLINNFHLTL